jgi:exodeoxyribonuclease-3
MKIISFNVNGIRATFNKDKLLPVFKNEKPDILCLQETKASVSQLSDSIINIDGYKSFFVSSETKKGYSGVCVYTKVIPDKVEYKLGTKEKELDMEGRTLILYFKKFVLINCYFPNGGMIEDRLKFKLRFYDEFLKKIEKIKKTGQKIIFCGDVNTAHNEIDLARPKENVKNTGFLPIERNWLDNVVKKGYIDIFRYLYPDKKDIYTYWDQKTKSRERNVGWRIDYFFVSQNIVSQIKDSYTIPQYDGSDHCPVVLELK